jgi:hypothetical protein
MIKDEAPGQSGINLLVQIQNSQKRYKYICPENNCNLIPEILNINSDIGKIVLKCGNNHLKIMDIEDYFKIIDEKENLTPVGASNVNAPSEIESSKKWEKQRFIKYYKSS